MLADCGLPDTVAHGDFLDNIEPSERVYHLGDPAGAIRRALVALPGFT